MGPRVAVASPNRDAADAGARMGGEGGNAVDAAVAAMLVTCVTEPGIVSLAGGAFATVAPADGAPPVTVDGYVEMPGRGLPAEAFGRGTRGLVTAYG
ncbi:MAG: gamma-glutamyltransferase, partial [Kineosporiaceae bacterium]